MKNGTHIVIYTKTHLCTSKQHMINANIYEKSTRKGWHQAVYLSLYQIKQINVYDSMYSISILRVLFGELSGYSNIIMVNTCIR